MKTCPKIIKPHFATVPVQRKAITGQSSGDFLTGTQRWRYGQQGIAGNCRIKVHEKLKRATTIRIPLKPLLAIPRVVCSFLFIFRYIAVIKFINQFYNFCFFRTLSNVKAKYFLNQFSLMKCRICCKPKSIRNILMPGGHNLMI